MIINCSNNTLQEGGEIIVTQGNQDMAFDTDIQIKRISLNLNDMNDIDVHVKRPKRISINLGDHFLKAAPANPVNLNEQLIKAAGSQDLNKVQDLIAKGAEADYVHKTLGPWGAYRKYSAVHSAMLGLNSEKKPTVEQEETWKEILKVLLKSGANPNETRDSYNWQDVGDEHTAFELLGNERPPDHDLFSAFIEAGLDPDLAQTRNIHSKRTDGFIKRHLLHDFARHGSVDCTIELLNAGANVDIRAIESIQNEEGYCEEKSETSFHVAVSKNKLEVCILLLAKGANINSIEYHYDCKFMEEIADQNKKFDPRDEAYLNPWSVTPIQCTALHLAIKERNLDLVCLLLACGADVGIVYRNGETDTISTFDWFKREKIDAQTPAVASKLSNIERALKGKLNMNSILQSFTPDVKNRIIRTLDRVQEIGWNFETCNFAQIYRNLKGSTQNLLCV